MLNVKKIMITLLLAGCAAGLFAASFEVQYKTNNTGTANNTISVCLQIVNNSGAAVDMNTLKVRYYYTKEGTAAEQFTCDWAAIGAGLVTSSFATPGYLEIGFTGGTVNNAAGSGEIQTRTNKTDWSNYDQSNDWSFVASTTYAVNSKICLYQNGNLVWGTPSGGTPAPTATPTITPGVTTPGDSSIGRISVSPATQTVSVAARPVINLLVNSGTQMVAAYSVTINYPSNLLSITGSDIIPGLSGFLTAVSFNTAGSLVAAGFDLAGKGPSAALDLLKMTFTALAVGTATIGMTVQTLTDAAYVNIGTPSGVGGTITITCCAITPTRTVTPGITTPGISGSGAGLVSVSPASQTITDGSRPTINLLVNSGAQVAAAYGVTLTYPASILSLTSADVVAGAQGFVSAVNANTAGTAIISGFDASGKGPGAAIDLVKITFSVMAAGNANIGLTVQALTDNTYVNIGTPIGLGGSITITGIIPSIPRTVTRTATRTVIGTRTVTRTATQPIRTPTRTSTIFSSRTGTRTVTRTVTRTASIPGGTPTVTATPGPTDSQAPGVGEIRVSPVTQTIALGNRPVIDLLVNSGTLLVAAYSLWVTYPANVLTIAAEDIVAAADGFLSAVNVNTLGRIVASGFDVNGKGPGGSLDLLRITFTANAGGIANLGVDVQSLTNEQYDTIGIPAGVGGTIIVTGPSATPSPLPTQTPTPSPTPSRTATGTFVPTATSAMTVTPSVGDVPGKVSLLPASQTVARGATVNFSVAVNTGTEVCAAYGITITFPSNLLSVTPAGVTAGAQGFVSASSANSPGILVVSGFDVYGKGPSSALALLNIAMTAGTTAGTANLTLTVQSLSNAAYAIIGTPAGSTAVVTIN